MKYACLVMILGLAACGVDGEPPQPEPTPPPGTKPPTYHSVDVNLSPGNSHVGASVTRGPLTIRMGL